MTTSVSLIDVINRFIESDEVTLPVFNTAASRIQQELAKKEPNIGIIEKIITMDQALSTQVLKFANSSFYRGLAEISTVRTAIMRLGMDETERVLVLAISRQHFKSTDPFIDSLMKKLWQHAVGCAYGAVWLSSRHPYGIEKSQAFLGGLFHDVGKLLILVIIEQIKQKNKALKITESLLMESMAELHAQVGHKLLAQWNMPESLSVIASDHHAKGELDDKNILLLLVRMANLACHKQGIGLDQKPSLILSATQEASLLNLTEIDLAELEILLEDTVLLRN